MSCQPGAVGPVRYCPACGTVLSPTNDDWHQVLVQFPRWDTAEQIAADQIRPRLLRAQADGVVRDWWFLRKHPCWRFRLRPRAGIPTARLQEVIRADLGDLHGAGHISRWWTSVYEPEALAFGGPRGIDVAHRLFHADSLGVLDYVHRSGPTGTSAGAVGRRELSVLLCSAMLRAAGQDWYEQGDVWHRVARMRSIPPAADGAGRVEFTGALHRLVSASTAPGAGVFADGSPLAFASDWAAAFRDAGGALGVAAYRGILQRGLRDVLAHLIIFHWNRLSLTSNAQAILAAGLRDMIMGQPDLRSGAEGDQ